jgi:hypothetical protein
MPGLSFLKSFTYNKVLPKIEAVANELNLKQPNMVLISGDDGKVATSEVSVKELSFLSNVNNNIQTQLNTGNTTMTNTSNELISRVQNVSSELDSNILATSNNVLEYLNIDSMPNGEIFKYVENGFYYGDLNIVGNLTVKNYSINGVSQSFFSSTITDVTEIASDSLNGPVLKIVEKAENNIIELGHGTETKVTMTHDGKLGIGTTTPVTTLDINGNVSASGTINGITTQKLSYLSGVTDNIQSQIDNFATLSGTSESSIGNLSLTSSSNMANNITNMSNISVEKLSETNSNLTSYINNRTDQKQDIINFSKTFVKNPDDNSISVKDTIWDTINSSNISYGNVVNVFDNKITINSIDVALISDVNSKQDLITGAATTITTNLLPANKLVVSDANGKVASYDFDIAKLDNLTGVSTDSTIQTQIDDIQTNINSATNELTTKRNTEYTNITQYVNSMTASELAKTDGKQGAINNVSGGSLNKRGNYITYEFSEEEINNIVKEQSYWTKAPEDEYVSYSNVQISIDNISTKIIQPFNEPRIVDSGIIKDNTSFVDLGNNQYIYSFKNTSNDVNSISFPQDTVVDVLIVAGGGAGGSGENGVGGGGGGGSVYVASNMVVPAYTEFPIIVGEGGKAAFRENGGNSSVFGITTIGGGAGGNSDAIHGISSGGGGGGGGINYYTSNVGMGGIVEGTISKRGADGVILQHIDTYAVPSLSETEFVKYPRENFTQDKVTFANNHHTVYFTYSDGTQLSSKSSSVFNADLTILKAFDGIKNNHITIVDYSIQYPDCWMTAQESVHMYLQDGTYPGLEGRTDYRGEWVMIDLGEQIILSKTKIYMPIRIDYRRRPREFRIYGTNDLTAYTSDIDSSEWNVVYEGVGFEISGDLVWHYEYDIPDNTQPYRYYCIIIHKVWEGGVFSTLGEWELFARKEITTYYPLLTKFPRENMDATTFTNSDGVTVACSSSTFNNNDVSHSPFKLFDGVLYSEDTESWLSGVNTYDENGNALVTYLSEYPGEWVMIDLGEDVILKETKLYPLTAQLVRQPKEFRIYGTNDKTAFGNINDNQWNKVYDGINPNETVVNLTDTQPIITKEIYDTTLVKYPKELYTAPSDDITVSFNEGDRIPHRAFNGQKLDFSTQYPTSGQLYNGTTRTYTGSANINGYFGEWLRIDLKENILLKKYIIYPEDENSTRLARAPGDFKIFGSRDNITHYEIDEQTGITHSYNEGRTFEIQNNNETYRYYTIVFNKIANTFSGNADCVITEWELYGYPEITNATNYTMKFPRDTDVKLLTDLNGEVVDNVSLVKEVLYNVKVDTNGTWKISNESSTFVTTGISENVIVKWDNTSPAIVYDLYENFIPYRYYAMVINKVYESGPIGSIGLFAQFAEWELLGHKIGNYGGGGGGAGSGAGSGAGGDTSGNALIVPTSSYPIGGAGISSSITKVVTGFPNRTKDMLAWYKFDGDLLDSSGNGKDLTGGTGTSFVDDSVVGTKSVQFPKQNNQSLISNIDLSGNKSFTISLWSYRNSDMIAQFMISAGDSYSDHRLLGIGYTVDNKFYFGFWSSESLYTEPLQDQNTWVHWTMIYDSDNKIKHLYKNGMLLKSTEHTIATNIPATTNNFSIGTRLGASPFDGKLDDVRIYNRALTPDEVTELYEFNKPKFAEESTDLLMWYKFDKGDVVEIDSYTDMIAWFKFEDSIEDSFGKHTVTLQNNPVSTNVQKKIGDYSLKLDRSLSQSFTIQNVNIDPVDKKELTISFWLYSTTTNYYQEILGYSHNKITIGQGWSGQYHITIYGTDSTLRVHFGSVVINVWTHFTVILTDTSLKIYHDNVLVCDVDIESSRIGNTQIKTGTNYFPTIVTDDIKIGSPHRTDHIYFSGYIDDLRFYNKIPTDQERDDIYNGVVINKNPYIFNSGTLGTTHNLENYETLQESSYGVVGNAHANLNKAYLQINSDFDSSALNECSICFWLKKKEINTAYDVIFADSSTSSEPFKIRRKDTTDYWDIQCFGGVFDTDGYLNDWKADHIWNHYSFIFENASGSTQLKIYKNNTLVYTNTNGTWTNTIIAKPTIGDINPDTSLMGNLDDIRVYNRVLTTTELYDLYNYRINVTNYGEGGSGGSTYYSGYGGGNLSIGAYDNDSGGNGAENTGGGGGGAKTGGFGGDGGSGIVVVKWYAQDRITYTNIVSNDELVNKQDILTFGQGFSYDTGTNTLSLTDTPIWKDEGSHVSYGNVKVYDNKMTIGSKIHNISKYFFNDTSNMLAWYKFDGDFTDSSGNGKDLTGGTGTSFVDDSVVGTKSISFPNTSSQTVKSSTLSLSGNISFTISLWTKRTTSGKNDFMICAGTTAATRQLLLISYGVPNYITYSMYGDDFKTVNTYTDVNTWVHWTFDYNGTTRLRQIYRNGILENSSIAAGTTNFAPTFNIGNRTDEVNCQFSGLIDDVRVFNRVLTPDEIAILYNNTPPVSRYFLNDTSDMYVWYKFNGYLNDDSGYSRDAIGYNSPTFDENLKKEGTHSVQFAGGASGTDSQYLTVPSTDFSLWSGFTVSCWVMFEDDTSDGRIFDFGDGQDANNIVLARNGSSNKMLMSIRQDTFKLSSSPLNYLRTSSVSGGITDIENNVITQSFTFKTASISSTSAFFKNDDFVASCTTKIPSSSLGASADGILMEAGATGTGFFLGIRENGTKLRMRAGAGSAGGNDIVSGTVMIVLDIPYANYEKYVDENTHEIVWEVRVGKQGVYPGRLRLWIDGVLIGSATTTGTNNQLNDANWAGTDPGGFGTISNTNLIPAGEPTNDWVIAAADVSNLNYYRSRLVSEDHIATSYDIVTTNDVIVNNTWMHISWVITKTPEWKLYVNGTLQPLNSSNSLYPVSTTYNNCYIAKSNSATDGYFKGKMDDFRLYKRALSGEEVKALYHMEIPTYSTGELYVNTIKAKEITALGVAPSLQIGNHVTVAKDTQQTGILKESYATPTAPYVPPTMTGTYNTDSFLSPDDNEIYEYAEFTDDGTITFSQDTECDVLVVGGGGAGNPGKGAGSAGGIIYYSDVIFSKNTYHVEVGKGGVLAGENGQQSRINGTNIDLIAVGGTGSSTIDGASGGTNPTNTISLSSSATENLDLVAKNGAAAFSNIVHEYPRHALSGGSATNYIYTAATVNSLTYRARIHSGYNTIGATTTTYTMNLFNKNTSDLGWEFYTNGFTSTNVRRTGYAGEYIMIDLVNPIILDNFILYPRVQVQKTGSGEDTAKRMPKYFRLYATNTDAAFTGADTASTGVNHPDWILLYERTSAMDAGGNSADGIDYPTQTTTTPMTVSTNTITSAYRYYMLIVNSNWGDGWGFGISEWKLNGKEIITGGGGGTGTDAPELTSGTSVPDGGDATMVNIYGDDIYVTGGGTGSSLDDSITGAQQGGGIYGYGGNSLLTSHTSGGSGIVIIRWKKIDENVAVVSKTENIKILTIDSRFTNFKQPTVQNATNNQIIKHPTEEAYYTTFTDTTTPGSITFEQDTVCDILVVGGGGAGGNSLGGGGGAGGVVYTINQVIPKGNYSIGVGEGGIGLPLLNDGQGTLGIDQYGKDSYIKKTDGTYLQLNIGGTVQDIVGKGGGGGAVYYNETFTNGRDGGSGGGSGVGNDTLNFIQPNTLWNGSEYIQGGSSGNTNSEGNTGGGSAANSPIDNLVNSTVSGGITQPETINTTVTKTFAKNTINISTSTELYATSDFVGRCYTKLTNGVTGCLWEAGGIGVGSYLGLRSDTDVSTGGTLLRLRAGTNSIAYTYAEGLVHTDERMAFLDIPYTGGFDKYDDDNVHEIVWEIRIGKDDEYSGRVRIWIDGELMGTAITYGINKRIGFQGSFWAGSNTGGFGNSSSNLSVGEPAEQWPLLTDLSSMDYYKDRLVSEIYIHVQPVDVSNDKITLGGGGGAGGELYNSSVINGKTGIQISITGTDNYYAAGGGGGQYKNTSTNIYINQGIGGNSIGGNGRIWNGTEYLREATDGLDGTGSGGGGGSYIDNPDNKAGNGGSGIVIIKWYPTKKAVYDSKEYCLRTKRNIWMDSANVIWTSDIRIKKDIEDINDDSALEQVLRLEPKTYKYKNVMERGNNKVFGFVSQQVEKVIPEATTKTANFIPNIYEHCEFTNTTVNNIPHSTITLPVDYDIATLSIAMNSSNISTRVRVINEKNENAELDFLLTSNVSGYGLMTEDISDFTNNSSNVFVYGTEVEDLTTIDKSYLYTLNVCATQVLSRKIDTLEASNSAMVSRIEQLESELNTLQNYLK